jgi:hypothetical protein
MFSTSFDRRIDSSINEAPMQEFCICCSKPGEHSITLAEGPQASRLLATPRYYLPNQHVRNPDFLDVAKEIHFCAQCMRHIEDTVRATILYLQAENDQVSIRPV